MDFYNKPSPTELYHYGVLGMKWGVRRYQNYDGTYTQRGLARYRKTEANYKQAKKKASATKEAYKSGNASKQQYKSAKGEVKTLRRQLKKNYDKLKTDKAADEGKKLYQQGKTITGNRQKTAMTEMGIVAASGVVTTLLSQYGDSKIASISGTTIAAGGTMVNGLLAMRSESMNKKLRAYYAHS